ncbi:hypothetical protein DUNSADRAFT_16630 [Dunaliella salina]|uniref:Encoded protein n=1 Tax=Dunaliella salina TaxID=3046 RepID=A0ABQ7G378_DUNSA|nr:hypothetical protein DUNSADRAFT_16630 [Dunaliella salina]|eukprot:KAF5829059.1 hypothetical protein DUNSADRAFT_16630 [Dunaliella salina]
MDTDSLEDTDSSFEDMSQPGRAAAGFPTQHSAQPTVRSIQEEEERRPLYRTPFGPTRSSGTPQGYHTAAEAAAQGPGTGAGPPGFSFGGDGSEEDLATPTSIPNPLFSEREESQTLEDERVGVALCKT